MNYISVTNNLIHTIARQVVSDEAWFKRLPMTDRGRCINDLAAEIAESANNWLNHQRENLGAFDADPESTTQTD